MKTIIDNAEKQDAASAAEEMQRALALALCTDAFAKAPRMSQLLSFLVAAKLSGSQDQFSEYAIGLAVFRRDPQVYHPALDPVVRVQMGRLRERLAASYRALGAAARRQITIPPGSYVPVLTAAVEAPPSWRCQQLQLAALRNLSGSQGNDTFVCGLNEELGAVLFHMFGDAVQLHGSAPTRPGGNNLAQPDYCLEGSIRMDPEHVRASVRLLDAAAGRIAWLGQFDCRGELGIPLQEALAGVISRGLQRYLVRA
ncbi:hypothetical protein [Rugamonas aquatica]|uniref:Uncharacterized protein n=1 Tax=Rugamonas aquatica TaxID=2743357 RepID=A0A6A7N8I7_9BURK|nr:hypothetical protein [Rugamonas aquatica]MQA41410.1 hypothetical protein [Rugamonas aquatica]